MSIALNNEKARDVDGRRKENMAGRIFFIERRGFLDIYGHNSIDMSMLWSLCDAIMVLRRLSQCRGGASDAMLEQGRLASLSEHELARNSCRSTSTIESLRANASVLLHAVSSHNDSRPPRQ